MKLILTTTLLTALSAATCLAGPKEDVKAALAKLADAPCYSWTASTDMGNFSSKITGKCEKGGYTLVSSERDGNVTSAVMKGDKGVVQTDSGWKTAEELRAAAGGGGGGGGGWMRGAMLLRSQGPGDIGGRLVDKVKELTVANGVISGALTDEGAKEQLTMGRGRGGGQGQGPEPKNAKGAVKYWLKDGQLTKMELTVSGTMAGRDGNERDINRTTTYEIKDVGTTKVEVPAEAKSKLGS